MKTHISLNVTDVAKSIEFYKKMFGIEPYKVKSNYAKFDVADPPLNLTMNQTEFAPGGSLSHLGLQVAATEDVMAIGRRWQENGLLTISEDQTDCCFALQNKTWTTDPDGNEWEVFTVLSDTEGPENTASACCTPGEKTVSITSSAKTSCV